MMSGVVCEQERWLRAFVGLYLEVEAGLRPSRHIRPLMAVELQPAIGNCGRRGPIPEVLTVRVQLRRGVCEAVVLLREQGRISALALSVRREAQGWRITEVRRPDDPPRPLPTEPDLQPLAQITWHEVAADGGRPVQDLPTGWRRPSPSAPARAA